jgi:hypothetical protein
MNELYFVQKIIINKKLNHAREKIIGVVLDSDQNFSQVNFRI